VCSGSSADFNNNVVFDNVRLQRHRMTFGVQLQYQMVHFGFSALTDLVAPEKANTKETDQVSAVDPTDPSGNRTVSFNRFAQDPRPGYEDNAVSKQWTVSWELGAAF
jgi:hypothetical protein